MSTTTATQITPRMIPFLTSLLAERVHPYSVTAQDVPSLTARDAHVMIDYLLASPRIMVAAPAGAQALSALSALPEVPAGRYAVDVDGVLRFYVVDLGKGRWAGCIFVTHQSSDNELRISHTEQASALALIAIDPHAATVHYGRELGVCGVCGRALTDEESRAAGIGPVCAARF